MDRTRWRNVKVLKRQKNLSPSVCFWQPSMRYDSHHQGHCINDNALHISRTWTGVGIAAGVFPCVLGVGGAVAAEDCGLELGTVEVLLTNCVAGSRGVTLGGGTSVLSTLFSGRGALTQDASYKQSYHIYDQFNLLTYPEAMDPRGCVKDFEVTRLGLETVKVSSVTVGWDKL